MPKEQTSKIQILWKPITSKISKKTVESYIIRLYSKVTKVKKSYYKLKAWHNLYNNK